MIMRMTQKTISHLHSRIKFLSSKKMTKYDNISVREQKLLYSKN